MVGVFVIHNATHCLQGHKAIGGKWRAHLYRLLHKSRNIYVFSVQADQNMRGVSAAAAVRTYVHMCGFMQAYRCTLRLCDAAAAAVAAAAPLVSRVDMREQSLFRATVPACPCAGSYVFSAAEAWEL